jgi:site-specific DNA-methyltransferase (adenine-specific)
MQIELLAAPELLTGAYQITQADSVEWLKTLPDSSIDCVIIDPAYDSLEKHRARGTTTRLKVSKSSSNQWFPIFPNDRYLELFYQLFRVLKNNSHFYCFCDQETMFILKPIGEAVGFKFWKPIVWNKVSIGMGYHYRAQYEFILFFEKGKRSLNGFGTADILTCNRVSRGYPTEKPVPLLSTLITQSTDKGAIVLDCFMGSCSTGVAALENDRRFVGCDISDSSIELANSRLEFGR